MVSLSKELDNAEFIWRRITRNEQPMFADMPIERVEPEPKNQRHWMFATDNDRILAHVYKPDYVLAKFNQIVIPMFSGAYNFKPTEDETEAFALHLVQDTFTYLLFHELFHPVFCPKSNIDREKFDVALKNGIKRAEPHLTPRDVVNKAGNSRNAMWDFFIDTFFFYKSINGHAVESLHDGVITTWDVVELADNKPKTLFYPITRGMYSLLFCNSEILRRNVFDYFRRKIGNRMTDKDLEDVIVRSLSGAAEFLDDADLRGIRVDKSKFLDSVAELYEFRATPKGNAAHPYVVKVITELGVRTELRYGSLEGIIGPLSKYIDLNREEKRDGAYTQETQQSEQQTPTSQAGGGAEQVLQSLINQGDQDLQNYLPSIANDQSAPQTPRNTRLSNLAKDEHYKRHAKELPIRSPLRDAETIEVGKRRIPVKVQELLLKPEEIVNLPLDRIQQFQLETGIQCLFQLSEHQYKLDVYEWHETPIIDFRYVKHGIILPDNVIFRVDGSGSMLMPSGHAFVGSGGRYDCLMHVVYGTTKSLVKAAKEMEKEVYVIGVSYSQPGRTKISEPVELQTFFTTPNNSVKAVLLNPDGGATHHDIDAFQKPYELCKPGKVLEVVVADGDLDNDHDAAIREMRKILSAPEHAMAYFPIFQEGHFARRVKLLSEQHHNLTYQPFMNFDALQNAATDLIIQYEKVRERFRN